MQRAAVITVAVLAVCVSACSGTEVSEATVSTTAPAVEETTTTESSARAESDPIDEVEVVECAELEGPVNLAVQSVGCTVDGAPAPVSALPCDDGRTVLIAGNRSGIEGETWQPYDLATGPPAGELC